MPDPTKPPALTDDQVAAIKQQLNLASAKSYPGIFTEIMHGMTIHSPTAIFLFQGDVPAGTPPVMVNASMSEAERLDRANSLLFNGYGGIMLESLCWNGADHFETFSQWRKDGMNWYPPMYDAAGQLIPRPGQPGGVSLPGADHPGQGTIGPWPDKKPDNWINIPDVDRLLEPGADVPALLAGMFGGKKP
jgi:hypothetical protein